MANIQHIPNLSALSGALQGGAEGLSAGLQNLTARKLEALKERETENRLYNTLIEAGYSPKQAAVGKLLGQKNIERILEMKPEGQTEVSNAQKLVQKPQQQDQIQQLESILQKSKAQTPSVGSFETAQEIGKTNLESLLGKQTQPEAGQLPPINANDLINQARMAGLNPTNPEKWAQKIQAINENAELRKAYEPLLQQLKQQQSAQQMQGAEAAVQKQPEAQAFLKSKSNAQQNHIDNINEKQLKPLHAMIADAQSLKGLANKGIEILESKPNVKTGIIYSRTPLDVLPTIANQETQDIARVLKGIVTVKSQLLKGNPTVYRVKNLEESKLSLSQDKQSLLRDLKNEIKDADKVLNLDKIERDLIKQNNNKQPENLRSLILDVAEAQETNKSQSFEVGQTFDKLPPASSYKGAEVIDEVTGKRLISDGKNWKEVK